MITREIEAIGKLFPNGGETYSQEELLMQIEPYIATKEDGIALIEQAVKEGFIIESTDKVYTR